MALPLCRRRYYLDATEYGRVCTVPTVRSGLCARVCTRSALSLLLLRPRESLLYMTEQSHGTREPLFLKGFG